MGTSGEGLDKSSSKTSSTSTTDTNANKKPSSTIGDTNTNANQAKPEEKEKGFLENFFETIRREIRDISYIEVVTAIGDVKADVNPDAELVIKGLKEDADVTIKARTRIELDGDIMVWLPTNKIKQDEEITINQQIMDIHKENVKLAVENWNHFMDNIFSALRTLIDITGLSKSQVEEKLSQPPTTETPAKPQVEEEKKGQ